MKNIPLILQTDSGESDIVFRARRVVNAGYVGRNQEEVARHVEELKLEGIPAPESTPVLFHNAPTILTQDDEILVYGGKTSGEAEFVLLYQAGEVYVGTGSDHTDRELESVSITKSKLICPNIMSRAIWRLADVLPQWDRIMLRSWVDVDGEPILYQEAPLAAILSPHDLKEFVMSRVKDGDDEGLVIFSGTISTIPVQMLYGDRFTVQLEDPHTGRSLSCSYAVARLDYLRE